jgi:hypothetical protein
MGDLRIEVNENFFKYCGLTIIPAGFFSSHPRPQSQFFFHEEQTVLALAKVGFCYLPVRTKRKSKYFPVS